MLCEGANPNGPHVPTKAAAQDVETLELALHGGAWHNSLSDYTMRLLSAICWASSPDTVVRKMRLISTQLSVRSLHFDHLDILVPGADVTSHSNRAPSFLECHVQHCRAYSP